MAKTKTPSGAVESGSEAAITVPLGKLPVEGYLPTHVDVNLSDRSQRATLKRATEGLMDKGARLKNGRRVQNGADAVRWILEETAKHTSPDVVANGDGVA